MFRKPLLILLAGAALLAQGVPDRPEQLVFKPLAFQMPRTGAYQARLKNGIQVLIHPDPAGSPLIRLSVLFKGGAFLDPNGKEGLADLTVSQMRQGGTRTTPADALDERLEILAADLNSGLDQTDGYASLTVLDKDLKEGMVLLMQVLTQPAFAQERLDQAKAQATQGILARNDNVPAIADAEMIRLLNGPSHFTSDEPTPASLAAITREDMLSLHSRMVHPENMVVSLSGRIRREVLLDLLDRTLGSMPAGRAALPPPPVPEHTRAPGIYVVDKPGTTQSMVQFALPGLRRTDPDWHAAVVMNNLLGGASFTARLMKKIRSDEGLTYGISTRFDEGVFWRGDWMGSFQTKNRSVAFALRLTLAELERIRAEQVSREELAVIKDSIIQAFPGQWSRQREVVATFAKERLAGWPDDWWADYREKIQAVTAEDVQRVARKYLDPSRLVILVVGGAAEAEAGDAKDHPGPLKDVAPLPMTRLPLRDPLTLKPLP